MNFKMSFRFKPNLFIDVVAPTGQKCIIGVMGRKPAQFDLTILKVYDRPVADLSFWDEVREWLVEQGIEHHFIEVNTRLKSHHVGSTTELLSDRRALVIDDPSDEFLFKMRWK